MTVIRSTFLGRNSQMIPPDSYLLLYSYVTVRMMDDVVNLKILLCSNGCSLPSSNELASTVLPPLLLKDCLYITRVAQHSVNTTLQVLTLFTFPRISVLGRQESQYARREHNL